MRKVFTFLFCALSLCAINACGQTKVKGSGKVVVKNHKVEKFNKLYVDGVFNIYLIQGDSENIKVEMDENLHQYLSLRLKGGQLRISTKDNIQIDRAEKKDIYITCKELNEIVVESVGDVKTKNQLKTGNLKVVSHGVGSISLDLDCNDLELKSEGVGSCDLKGRANNFVMKNSGVGTVNSKGLIAEYVEIDNSGVGNVSVYANKELSIDNSGIGGITYYGDAALKNLNLSGIGNVKKGK